MFDNEQKILKDLDHDTKVFEVEKKVPVLMKKIIVMIDI